MNNVKTANAKVTQLVLTAMIMCLIILMIFLIRVPIPFTQGYVNLSDGIIFIGIFLLGRRNGAVAAALGSAMGDVLGGFAMWAPWTFVIKGGMALIVGFACEYMMKTKLGVKNLWVTRTVSMILGGLFMVAGYYVAEGVMYGNWITAALGVPWNGCQFIVGIVLAIVITVALEKTGAINTKRIRYGE
ncbi:MAG: ECF transporter S component [Bacillota bacterium]|nr:ECF transporter S component [Bacillota bacterium]